MADSTAAGVHGSATAAAAHGSASPSAAPLRQRASGQQTAQCDWQ
jgi:hypothetical protein